MIEKHDHVGTYQVAHALSKLPEDTEPNDWPYRALLLQGSTREDFDPRPDLWALICLLAGSLLGSKSGNLILRTWLLIEAVNGLRRQKGMWDINVCVALLDKAQQNIQRVPQEHSRKPRLQEMRAYHGGWVYHLAGEFAKAAKCHKESEAIERQKGDDRGVALAAHNRVYEELNALIVAYELDRTALARKMEEFTEANRQTLDKLTGNNAEDRRWRANVLLHQFWNEWVCSGQAPKKKDVEDLKVLCATLDTPSFVETAKIIRAIWMIGNSQRSDGVELLDGADRDAPGKEWGAYLVLVQHKAREKKGEVSARDSALGAINKLLEHSHGGHLPLAILRHDLLNLG